MYKVNTVILFKAKKDSGLNPKKWSLESEGESSLELTRNAIGFIDAIDSMYNLRLKTRDIKNRVNYKAKGTLEQLNSTNENVTKYLLRETHGNIRISISITKYQNTEQKLYPIL